MGKILTDSLVIIIIVLISALIIFNFLVDLKKAYAVEKTTCKASVRAHTALKLRYADFSEEIKCPTVRLKIEDKKEDTKKKLADAMYDCWDQFGRGQLELFTDDSVYCSLCHRISFANDIKVNGLTKYLAETKTPKGESSYLQFLTTEETDNADFLKEYESRKIVDSIDASTNNEYAVIFTYIKGKKNLEKYLEKAKYTAPGVGLIGLGFGIFKAGGFIGGGLSTIATPAVGVPVGLTISSAGALTMSIGTLWSFLAGYFADVPFEHIALISFTPYDAKSLQDLNCKEIPIKQT